MIEITDEKQIGDFKKSMLGARGNRRHSGPHNYFTCVKYNCSEESFLHIKHE